MTNSKNFINHLDVDKIEILSLIQTPSFPSIPSTSSIYPLTVKSECKEYMELVQKYNIESERDKKFLQEMRLFYDEIDDKYKQIIRELLKHSNVQEDIALEQPQIQLKGNNALIYVTLGLTLSEFGLMIAAWRVGKHLKTLKISLDTAEFVLVNTAEDGAVYAGRLKSFTQLQARVIRSTRVLKLLKGGLWATLGIGLVWMGYETYSDRNDTIRELEKVKDELRKKYEQYNQLANYLMEQATMLRNLIISFNIGADGKGSLKFKLNEKEKDYERLFERVIIKDAKERQKMTEDDRRHNDEDSLIRDLRWNINHILTGDLTRMINFNSACTLAFNSFRAGQTIKQFVENVNQFSETKLTDDQIKAIYNEAQIQKDVKTEDAKFFNIYTTPAVMKYTEMEIERKKTGVG